MGNRNEKTLLDVTDLTFSFKTYAGEVQAVRGVSFSLEKGKSLGLVGESGCGKTTILRMISGLETPDKGEIWFDDKCVFSSEKKINLF